MDPSPIRQVLDGNQQGGHPLVVSRLLEGKCQKKKFQSLFKWELSLLASWKKANAGNKRPIAEYDSIATKHA